MTSQYKHYSAAMIKDNLTVNKKRTHDTTDRIMSEKSSEFSTNTKLIPSSQIIPKNFPKRQKLENVYQVKKIWKVLIETIPTKSCIRFTIHIMIIIIYIIVRILVGRFVYVFLFRLWTSRFVCLLGWHCCRFLGRSSLRAGFGTFSSLSFCSCTWVFRSAFRVVAVVVYGFESVIWS